jgi:hypothetical protein
MHWTAQRAYPEKVLPSRGLADAYAYSKANLAEDLKWNRAGASRPRREV